MTSVWPALVGSQSSKIQTTFSPSWHFWKYFVMICILIQLLSLNCTWLYFKYCSSIVKSFWHVYLICPIFLMHLIFCNALLQQFSLDGPWISLFYTNIWLLNFMMFHFNCFFFPHFSSELKSWHFWPKYLIFWKIYLSFQKFVSLSKVFQILSR